TMKLKNRGSNDAVNRRISLLVLNHDTQAAIEKENSESDAAQVTDPAQIIPDITAPTGPAASTAPAGSTAKPAAPTNVVTPAPADKPAASAVTPDQPSQPR
ncbi:flagellar motor protein MotB, partial [Pantoea rodasii]